MIGDQDSDTPNRVRWYVLTGARNEVCCIDGHATQGQTCVHLASNLQAYLVEAANGVFTSSDALGVWGGHINHRGPSPVAGQRVVDLMR